MLQQKQKEIQGQFQDMKQQVETFNTANYALSLQNNRITSTSKHKAFSQKQKIALLLTSNTKEMFYSPSINKSNTFYHGKILKIGSVTFRSNYQCGNIGTVDLVGINLYRISLDLQSNSSRGNTWFYFTVEGAKGQVQFIIQGFTKKTSLYNEDMKICYRDMKQQNKWRRGCTNISYTCRDQQAEVPNYQLRFKYFFKNNQNHSVQFAYAFPYSFNRLQNFINTIYSKVKIQILGKTYDGKEIPMIIIGNHNSQEVIVISSRVHPGETCSSFIVQGFIKELLSNNQHAVSLRQKYLFKIVPMINIDGVFRGNYRFSAIGVDLNRKWKQPSQQYHPQIFYLRQMILRQNKQKKIIMYIDIHGHSRKKNVFFYGCPILNINDQSIKTKSFPYLMSKIHEPFNFYDCSFNIQKQKEGTARISIWKQLKINEVFTLQASMCSSSLGKNYTEMDYEKIGRKLCEGICIYFANYQEKQSQNMKKQYKFKENIMNQFKNDPFLQKIGNQEDGGSQSQPQKGQNTGKYQLQKSKKKKNPKVNGYNFHSKNKTKVLKQNSQSISYLQDNQLIKQKQTFQFLFQTPKKNQSKQKNIPNTAMRNSRLGNLSKNIYYKTAIKYITYDESETQFQKLGQKNKMNLLVNWEGAQYRRVRKTAEDNWRKQANNDIEIKGISTKKIQIQKNKALIPKLVIKNKLKRTSAQIYSKKAMRLQQMQYMGRDELNVICRGRHIKM